MNPIAGQAPVSAESKSLTIRASRWSARSLMVGECLFAALNSVRIHALRSTLTALGVVIGVAAVICVVSLVQGMSRTIATQFLGLGGSTLTVRADTPFEQQLQGQRNLLRPRDLEQLSYRIDGIRNLTPQIAVGGGIGMLEVRNGSRATVSQIIGTTADFIEVNQSSLRFGRFLSPADDTTRRRVAVIGEKVRHDLGLQGDPVGQYLSIGGEWFKVIGLMEARGELFGISQDNYLLLPYQTALGMTGGDTKPDLTITFNVDDADNLTATKDRITALMRSLHRLKPGARDDFVVESSASLAQSFHDISNVVTLVISAIVGISLMVSGVGIMNIMLVSVTERTREIGIAKALGAPVSYIRLQFLLEASIVAGAGGIAGILIGDAAAWLLSAMIPGMPGPELSLWITAAAFMFSVATGVGFGYLPATRASRLAPIEALRHE